MARYLIVPGWAGSGPTHWQTHWERALVGASRVEMSDWYEPRRDDWVATLDAAIRAADEPPILIAHSLGCLAAVHWSGDAPVAGALLVAPVDVDRAGCPDHLRDFAPVPRRRLSFPSRVIASTDDSYASLAWSREAASVWGSELTVLERAGHINAISGFGPWPEGRDYLSSILDTRSPTTLGGSAEEDSIPTGFAPFATTARR